MAAAASAMSISRLLREEILRRRLQALANHRAGPTACGSCRSLWLAPEEQKRKWIGEATSDPTAEYLAGWTVSEQQNTGGTAISIPLASGRWGSALLRRTIRDAANIP